MMKNKIHLANFVISCSQDIKEDHRVFRNIKKKNTKIICTICMMKMKLAKTKTTGKISLQMELVHF